MQPFYGFTGTAGCLLFLSLIISPNKSAMAEEAGLKLFGSSSYEVMMYIENADREVITYSSYDGHENEERIAALNYELGFEHYYDPAAGDGHSTMVHRPFVVTSSFTAVNPMYISGFQNKEVYPYVIFRYYQPDNTGGSSNYYTITLQNVRIRDLRTQPGGSSIEIKFVPDTITIKDEYSGVEAEYGSYIPN